MAIYLVQHGISLPKEEDPERGLSREGSDDVKRIALDAQSHKIGVRSIQHSGKKRAEQTAEIFAAILQPAEGVLQKSGMGPMDDVKPFAAQLDSSSGAMYIGHLPFMETLIGFLAAGDESKSVFKFQNGGIVCLAQRPDKTWHIKWALMPRMD